MGNCQKKDQALTVTNFDDDKWSMVPTTIHTHCFMLKNYYHPNIRLFKWIATSNRKNKISKMREQLKVDYLPSIYETGETRKPRIIPQDKQNKNNAQKTPYIVTQQLVCLKDLALSFDEATIISFQSLKAYQQLLRELGGFVARENMIYISREGAIKVWVNQNLADNEFQFPHPAITEQQFISSLLHQIFTRVVTTASSNKDAEAMYEYMKLGSLNFSQVLSKLSYIIKQKNLQNQVSISKEAFDKILNYYQINQNLKKSVKTKKNDDLEKQKPQNSLQKGLKFIVAEGEREGNESFVKDYSKKNIKQLQSSQILNRYNQTWVSPRANPIGFSHPQYVLINQSFTSS